MDIPLKIVLVGDSMVGKSSICKSYIKRVPYLIYQPTISETHDITISIDSRDFPVILWDTAGVEEWDTLRIQDYSNCDCFILCYAVNNADSFINIQSKWVPELQKHCPGVPILLVATKTDQRISYNRITSAESGNELKHKIKAAGFAECTAKSIATVEGVLIQAVSIAQTYKQLKLANNARKQCKVL